MCPKYGIFLRQITPEYPQFLKPLANFAETRSNYFLLHNNGKMIAVKRRRNSTTILDTVVKIYHGYAEGWRGGQKSWQRERRMNIIWHEVEGHFVFWTTFELNFFFTLNWLTRKKKALQSKRCASVDCARICLVCSNIAFFFFWKLSIAVGIAFLQILFK